MRTEASIKRLTNLYSLARRARFLDASLGRWAFTRAYFLYKRYLEDPYYALAQQHPELFHGGNILDIGANIGYTASVFSSALDPAFKVYAFEPESFNFALLERSAAGRKTQNRIVPVQSAVGDHDGTIELWENQHHHADHRILTEQFRHSNDASQVRQVPITRVDTFVAKQPAEFPVRFIKVDVQGYELPACKGMERTLASNPDAILALEYMPSAMRELGFQPEELIQWLQQLGYHVCTVEKAGRLRPGIPTLTAADSYCDLLFFRALSALA